MCNLDSKGQSICEPNNMNVACTSYIQFVLVHDQFLFQIGIHFSLRSDCVTHY